MLMQSYLIVERIASQLPMCLTGQDTSPKLTFCWSNRLSLMRSLQQKVNLKASQASHQQQQQQQQQKTCLALSRTQLKLKAVAQLLTLLMLPNLQQQLQPQNDITQTIWGLSNIIAAKIRFDQPLQLAS